MLSQVIASSDERFGISMVLLNCIEDIFQQKRSHLP